MLENWLANPAIIAAVISAIVATIVAFITSIVSIKTARESLQAQAKRQKADLETQAQFKKQELEALAFRLFVDQEIWRQEQLTETMAVLY